MKTDSPNTVVNLVVAYATPDPKHIWIDGDTIRVYTGADIPKAPVPAEVTPRQIRLALNGMGLRSAVDLAIASMPQDVRDTWEYSTVIERNHPLIAQMARGLKKSDDEVDALFALAAGL